LIVELKKNQDKIDFTELVGKETIYSDRVILIHLWDNDRKELGVIIKDLNKNQIGAEVISLAFGLVVFIEKLEGYGFQVVITEGLSYSLETIQKAQGLIQAGFEKLIKNNDVYTIDSIFPQTILREDELQHLLENSIEELRLSEIK
jgi:hypothetical protein